MSVILSNELPIGFGLGKTSEYWQDVLSQVIDIGKLAQNPQQSRASTQDVDVLTAEETALLLRCSLDSNRRLSREELPARVGPGGQLLYLHDDILDYLRGAPGIEKRGSGFGNKRELGVSKGKHKEFDLEAAKSNIVET